MVDGIAEASLFSLKKHRALITGGSVSIGQAIAVALAQAGADVALQYSPGADAGFGVPDAATSTCRLIEAMGRRSHAIAADFTLAGEGRRTVEEAVATLGGVDILVIAASVQKRQSFESVTRQDVDWQASVNFHATIELLQAALPAMAARRCGRVLSIGSVNQLRPEAELSVYAALKAAQANLIANLARSYASTGVTLNTLSPGLVATERNRSRRENAEDWERIQHGANPMHRAGLPEDIVGAALLLCSPASSFLTGADLQVTGGAHL
jgi:glucose 1-dehydrogenase